MYTLFTGSTGGVFRKHVVFHCIHLYIHEETLIPGPVSCRCPSGLLETPPRWHATIYMFTLCLQVALVGCLGNMLCFTVFTCTFMRRLSSSIYLAALSLADFGNLCYLCTQLKKHFRVFEAFSCVKLRPRTFQWDLIL